MNLAHVRQPQGPEALKTSSDRKSDRSAEEQSILGVSVDYSPTFPHLDMFFDHTRQNPTGFRLRPQDKIVHLQVSIIVYALVPKVFIAQ